MSDDDLTPRDRRMIARGLRRAAATIRNEGEAPNREDIRMLESEADALEMRALRIEGSEVR